MANDDFEWDEKPELNITPLVDIMLVLLAILMVSTPTITYEENITLPRGSKTQKVAVDKKIEVRIDEQKNIYVLEEKYNMRDFADNFVLYSKNIDKQTSVHIRADKNLQYQDVIYVLKVIKEAGFLRASLVTSA